MGRLLTFLGGIQNYLMVSAVTAALAFGAGAYFGYRWELGALNGLKLADAQALQKATTDAADKQHKVDLSGQSAAISQAYIQGKLDGTIVTFKTEAPANVTVLQDQQAAAADGAGCITYGFYRMLAAGERGVTPDSLPIPAGESVDACTGEQPSDLATRIAQDLGAGYGNSQHLDALISEVTKQEAIRAATHQ